MEEEIIRSLMDQAERKIAQRRLSATEATTGSHIIGECRQYLKAGSANRLRMKVMELAVFFEGIDVRLVPQQRETAFIARLKSQVR